MSEFVLKNQHGEEVVFDHNKIFVKNTNGNLIQFTEGKGEAVLKSLEVTENGRYTPNDGVDGFDSVSVNVEGIELQEKTVALSLLSGDQIVEADVDKAMSKVTVQKPSTLIPENIAEGVDIAGIIGTLVAGGATNFKYGSFTGNGGAVEITHGLGVTPDVVMVVIKSGNALGTKSINFIVGLSSALVTLLGVDKGQRGIGYYSAWSALSSANPIENSDPSILYGANEETFIVGNPNGYVMKDGTTYIWFAASGLV